MKRKEKPCLTIVCCTLLGPFFHYFILGAENAGKEIPKEYLLKEGKTTIEMILSGNPQPKLSYTFQGKTKEAKMVEKVDDSKKIYKYEIVLENVDQNDCGSTIEFKATGFKNWRESSIVRLKCKNYFISTMLLFWIVSARLLKQIDDMK